MKIAIYGSGELGVQLLNFLSNQQIEVVGFIDDTKKVGELVLDNYKVIGNQDSLFNLFSDGGLDSIVVAIGYKHLNQKQKIIAKLQGRGIQLFSFVHPSAQVDPSVIIKEGVIIYPGCIVDKNVVLYSGVLLNNGCIISHDSRVGSCTFVAPGVVVSGFNQIGERCFIGSGSVTVDNINISDDSVFGAGALITNNVKEPGTYVGAPIRKIK